MTSSTPCAWCGLPLDPASASFMGPSVQRCARCGVGTTTPWPDDDELDAAYADWYRPETGRFSAAGDRILRRTRGRLARRIDAIAPPGPVLDIGSGDGSLVDALRRTGRAATGLERIDAADGDPMAGVSDRYAAVALWHSLEHLRTPTATLAKVHDVLAPRGVVVIAVPNWASLQARAFGSRWFALDVPRHLVHIPADALRRQLEDLGFIVERTSHVRGGQVLFGWLDGLVGSLRRDLRLYDAIRRPEARQRPLRTSTRLLTLAAGVVLLPIAALATAVEVALRRGGSVYVEARRSATR
jgi:SAM-dependent methyltransferase